MPLNHHHPCGVSWAIQTAHLAKSGCGNISPPRLAKLTHWASGQSPCGQYRGRPQARQTAYASAAPLPLDPHANLRHLCRVLKLALTAMLLCSCVTAGPGGSGGQGAITGSDATAATTRGADASTQADTSAGTDAATNADAAQIADASSGADTSADAVFTPGPHPPVPTVLSGGGAVLKSPKVVTLQFGDDPNKANAAGFLQALATKPYWATVTAEYGVGPLTVGPAFEVEATAPDTWSTDDVGAALEKNLAGAAPPWGQFTPGTMYLFLIPAATAFADGDTACCDNLDGFHMEWPTDQGTVPFAVICTCESEATGGLTVQDVITGTIAHELIEAATDPRPNANKPGYSDVDAAHVAWNIINMGAELADMCENEPDANVTPAGFASAATRSWSNAAAQQGLDPCVPAPADEPYFAAAPEANDAITLKNIDGVKVKTKGIKAELGGDVQVPVHLFSAAPMPGGWTVEAQDASEFYGGDPNLTFSWDKTTGNNGDTLLLTVHVDGWDPASGGATFFVWAKSAKHTHGWVGAVGK